MRLAFVASIYLGCFVGGNLADKATVWLFVWGVQGLILTGLLSVVHECSHKVFIRHSRVLNDQLGRAVATIIGLNYSLYRIEHSLHHKNLNGRLDTEPEIFIVSAGDYIRFLFINPHVVYMSRASLLAAFGRFPDTISSEAAAKLVKRDGRLVLLWAGLVSVSLFTASGNVVLSAYIVPLAISLVLDSFFSLPEHHGLRRQKLQSAGTRTILSNRFVRFFLWNVNFHTEHHLNPAKRYDELPRTHENRMRDLIWIERSYFGFHSRLIKGLVKTKLAACART